MSDAGGNFVSEKFKEFCRNLNIEQAISSSCHHKCNGHIEVCIKFIRRIQMKCFDTNADTYLVLLQVRSTQHRLGYPVPQHYYSTAL